MGEAERPEEFRDTHKFDDYFRRKKLGSGVYIERADIERMGATDVLGVLRGIPGVRATMETSIYGAPSTKLNIARCPGTPPPIAIYIDGLRVSVSLGDRSGNGAGIENSLGIGKTRCPPCEELAETLSLINIRNIEFVEFYRGVSQIPGDLERTDNCAVLVMWTR